MIRVFIVAASPLARAGLENLLAARGAQVVGSIAAIETLGDLLSEAAPDVVIVDSSGQPIESTLESVAASGLAVDVPLVIVGEGISAAASAEALRAGIRAALPADISPEQLVAALEAAASGLLVLHSSHVAEGLPAASSPAPALDELSESLTRREVEVLQMLAGGLSNKEIAARLSISDHTVKFHVASILGKLGAASRTEAVSIGIRRGLVLL
ncbi:MAG TPA: response regulator transcription factor [Candidatus Sulfotelmatobacter sp.]|nr:response regulator transcription factor [Candidatus Sulfotelmatobacter sp.]